MLEAVVDTLDGVPAQFHELYTEKNGKFEFTGVNGMKAQGDFDRINEALRKERNDHKTVREQIVKLGDRKVDDVLAALDRIPELEAAAAGKLDAAKIDELVEQRIRSKLAP